MAEAATSPWLGATSGRGEAILEIAERVTGAADRSAAVRVVVEALALYATKRTAERGAQLTLPIAAADPRDGRDPDSSSPRG